MADSYNPTLDYVDFPDLAKGMSAEAPSRTLVPGGDGPALFRDVTNMSRNHGALGSWYGVFPLAEFQENSYPTIQKDGTYFSTAPDGLINGQCPMWMFWDYPQSWNNSTSTAQSTYGKFMGIVVTSREIHVYSPQDHNWYNATPVYPGDPILPGPPPTYGTVDVSIAGLVSISTGTHPWDTRKIVPGQLIQFAGDANWYTITSVLTGPDRLQTDFAGAAKVNVAYTIRRCFGGRNYSHGDNLLFGTVFNGDLYIGGRTLAGAGVGPAVIRVSNIYDNVYVTEYLLAGFDLTGSMSANGSVVANLWDIKGLQILPDGRVVIATAEVPPTMTGIVGNRLRYSSNTASGSITAQELWNVSPGGFIDVVDHPGEITALGKLGPSTLTIHFHRGISLGTYTAQYDPPLSIQASGAKVGCFAPRTLSLFQGNEIFLGADGLVHGFDGTSTTPLCDETVDLTHNDAENAQSSFAIANCHGVVDVRKNYYRLFFCDNNFEQVDSPPAAYADYTTQTTCWLISLDDGAIFKETYIPHITACSNMAVGAADAKIDQVLPTKVGGDFGTLIIGIPSTSPSGLVVVGGEFLCGLFAGIQVDGVDIANANREWPVDYGEDVGLVLSFETDDLDFGNPGVDKTIDHILLWCSGSAVNSPFHDGSLVTISLSTDGGVTYPASLVYSNPETVTNTGLDKPYRFDFTPTAAEKWRIKVSRTSAASYRAYFGLNVHRMRVYYQTQGEIEAANPDL